MNINRIVRLQLIVLLIVAATLLASCGPRDTGSNRREGMDIIPVVSTSQIASNIANAMYDQFVIQDRGI